MNEVLAWPCAEPKAATVSRANDTPQWGAKRCKLHGGNNKPAAKGNTHAAKPGSLYSKYLTPEEQADFDRIELGRIDDELRLTRIRLARALAQEQEKGSTLEVESAVKRKGGGPQVATAEVHTKRRDYVGIIDRLTGRIASLEAQRASMLNMSLDAELKRLELKERGDEQNPEPPASRSFTFVVKDARRRTDDADDNA